MTQIIFEAFLNIIGRLPTPDEARVFLEDPGEAKRPRLIDSLVDSPGFHSRLFNFWSNLLRLQTNEDSHGLGWHVWLREAVDRNMPYDEMVRAMLSADGHAARNPAVGYYLQDCGMLLDNVSNTGEVFLDQQIDCAQCHDHPFDDTFDPKPDAPSEIRGPIKTIGTKVEGIRLGQHLEHTARHTDKMALVRSMSSTQGAHAQGNYHIHTAYTERASLTHPSLGSWASKLDPERLNHTLPPYVTVHTGNNHPGAGFFEPKVAPLPIGDADAGRTHFPKAFSFVLAGAGIKSGTVYGETDETASNVITEKPRRLTSTPPSPARWACNTTRSSTPPANDHLKWAGKPASRSRRSSRSPALSGLTPIAGETRCLSDPLGQCALSGVSVWPVARCISPT